MKRQKKKKKTKKNQQLQLKQLSPNFLQGSTVKRLFTHIQNIAQQGNMDLLITASSDLIQIDVSYFYKSHTINYLSSRSYGQSQQTTKVLLIHKILSRPELGFKSYNDAKY